MPAYSYIVPQVTLFGYDCLKTLGGYIKRLNVQKALVVTDESLVRLGIVGAVTDELAASGLEYAVFTGVKPNPTIGNVENGLAMLRAENCDFIVSIGGGSAHDCAKGIGLTGGNNCTIADLCGGPHKSQKPSIPLVMVNTTAGTASECTHAYVIVDEAENRKFGLRDMHAVASIAVDDHKLMMKLPKSLTAGTGMDALTHALEAYVSKKAQPITSALAIAAIKMIFKNLPDATLKSTEEAREGMAVGQYLAGLSFGNATCGLVHSMSHQLSAVYDLPHGLCNAILLPPVMRFNAGDERACALYAEIARDVFPFDCAGKAEAEQAAVLIEKVEELSETVGTKIPLTSIGVKAEDVSLLADKALKDGSLPANPRTPEHAQIAELYQSVL